MATLSPQPPLTHIKTAARKLPVKRKSPHSSSSAPSPPHPILPVKLDHSPNFADATPAPAPAPPRPADDFDDDDEEPDHDDADQDDGDAACRAGGGSIPFKFQRIWSEPDEIRFLQGLLACHSQGMTFPRDLNLYFDRFSETMTQPYSRSQLSEKLRRLCKKFRSHAARFARGLDPSALPPHDRDLFHLSTLLWDPAFAAASPFGVSSSGTVPGNKRRRHIPVAGGSGVTAGSSGVRARSSAVSSPPRLIHALPPPSPPTLVLPSPPPASSSPPPAPKDAKCDRGLGGCSGSQEEQPPSRQRKPWGVQWVSVIYLLTITGDHPWIVGHKRRFWSFPKFSDECSSNQCGDSSEDRHNCEVSASCSQMALQFHGSQDQNEMCQHWPSSP